MATSIRISWRCAVLTIAMGPGTLGAAASPVPALTLSQLVARADIVVAGTVTGVQVVRHTSVVAGTGAVDASLEAVSIRVDRVLKGALSGAALTVSFTQLEVMWASRPIIPGRYRVFFIKSQDGGGWQFVSSMQPSMPAAPGPGASAGDPLAAAVGAMGAVLTTPGEPVADQEEVLVTLGMEDNPPAKAVLRRALTDADQSLQFRAACMLFRLNDISGSALAEKALLGGATTPAIYLDWLRSAISTLHNPAALPFLTDLMKADAATSRAAAEALHNIASPSTAPELARAIESTDPIVQYWAVLGLREAAGQGGAMSQEYFSAHRDELVRQWRDWARARGLIK